MTDMKEPHPDPELRRWLRRWEVGPTPEALGRRILNSYERSRRRPRWSGVWHARISVPVPVAALTLLLLVTAGTLAARSAARGEWSSARSEDPAGESAGLADLRPLPEIRVAVIKGGSSDALR